MTAVTTYAVFLFDTTTAALWAEEVALERAIPAEVIPAPADADAKCDLALRSRAELARSLTEALQQEGVAFKPYA